MPVPLSIQALGDSSSDRQALARAFICQAKDSPIRCPGRLAVTHCRTL